MSNLKYHRNKRFDPALHAQCDVKGKALAIELLGAISNAKFIGENDETDGRPISGVFYDLNMFFPKTGKTARVEVENSSDRFKHFYPTVPARKCKADCQMIVVVCEDRGWVCPAGLVKSTNIITKPTPHGMEDFFTPRWDMGWSYKKVDGKWIQCDHPKQEKDNRLNFEAMFKSMAG